MTKPISFKNQTMPPYSGITINITNPTLNGPQAAANCQHHCNCDCHNQKNAVVQQKTTQENQKADIAYMYGVTKPNNINNENQLNNTKEMQNNGFTYEITSSETKNTEKTTPLIDRNIDATQYELSQQTETKKEIQNSYPPQYYLNNYNYIQNGEKNTKVPDNNEQEQINTDNNRLPAENIIKEEDMSSSENIINDLNTRIAEQQELEKNGTKKRVVALTNEYIMSLENYLNNPNTDIRLMAAKEILTRLDEDKDRYDDAALNALLNKMLQDPEKLVRIAALSAFSSQLASGNDYTITLLTKIQNNPNADKEDVIQAADSLLKMSSRTEIRYVKDTPVETENIKKDEQNFSEQQTE